MTDVVDIELELDNDSRIAGIEGSERADKLRSLAMKLEEVTNREVTDRRSRVFALLDAAVVLATIHAESVAILRDILIARLENEDLTKRRLRPISHVYGRPPSRTDVHRLNAAQDVLHGSSSTSKSSA